MWLGWGYRAISSLYSIHFYRPHASLEMVRKSCVIAVRDACGHSQWDQNQKVSDRQGSHLTHGDLVGLHGSSLPLQG